MGILTSIEPLYSISGFGVGFLIGMTGMGGGSLMTPLLILLFGIQPATAVGTDLLFAAATKSVGSVVHGLARSIHWRVVGLLAIGSIPATVATLVGLSKLDLHGAAASALITRVLGYALFGTAAVLVFRDRILATYAARISALDPRRIAIMTIIVGSVLGALVSISSVGAGDRCRGSDSALPAAAACPRCRLRHLPRCASDPRCWHGPLVGGLDRLAALGLASDRIFAGGRSWRPCRHPHAYYRPAAGPRRSPRGRRVPVCSVTAKPKGACSAKGRQWQ